MARITVQVGDWVAAVGIPSDEDVMDYLRRVYMLRACSQVSHSSESGYDPDKAAAMQALMVAVEAAYPGLPGVGLMEE